MLRLSGAFFARASFSPLSMHRIPLSMHRIACVKILHARNFSRTAV
jgi:hypothetical protein